MLEFHTFYVDRNFMNEYWSFGEIKSQPQEWYKVGEQNLETKAFEEVHLVGKLFHLHIAVMSEITQFKDPRKQNCS